MTLNDAPKTREPAYLHGYSPDEQDRLYAQARVFENDIYDTFDLSYFKTLLEVGSGVGAQTEILLRRFPQLEIDCVDASREQLDRAQKHLAVPIAAGKVRLHQADAAQLPFQEDHFDAAFLCWFLEHVPEPIGVLKEVRRTLRSGGTIYCTEVMHAAFFIHPYSPATQQFWFAFNDHQWNLKGDPFMGAKLGNYLMASGFQDVETRVKTAHYDNRMPKRRARMIEDWAQLVLSGAPALLAAKRVNTELVEEMKAEIARLKNDPDAVFFYSWVQATGRAY